MVRSTPSSIAVMHDECSESVNRVKSIKAIPITTVNDSENNICKSRAKSRHTPDKKNIKPRKAFTDIRNTKTSIKSVQPINTKKSMVEDAVSLEIPIESCSIDQDKEKPVNKVKSVKITSIMTVNDSENNICRAKSHQIPDKKNVKPSSNASIDIRNIEIRRKSIQPTKTNTSTVEDAMYLEKYPPIERCPIDLDKEPEYEPAHLTKEERYIMNNLSDIFYEHLVSSFTYIKEKEIECEPLELPEIKDFTYPLWNVQDADSLPQYDDTPYPVFSQFD